MLHSNIAFPLLKELYKAGDQKAKKYFKQEIAKRIKENYGPTIELLIYENYLEYLNEDELNLCLGKELNVERLNLGVSAL